jgi:hypothetical protein
LDLAARLDLLDKTYAFLIANERLLENQEVSEEYFALVAEYLDFWK